jgi:hypothetical protein
MPNFFAIARISSGQLTEVASSLIRLIISLVAEPNDSGRQMKVKHRNYQLQHTRNKTAQVKFRLSLSAVCSLNYKT